MSGKFVVVEGIDNTGKTTLIRNVILHIKNAMYLKTPIEPYLTKCREFDILYGETYIEKRFELFIEGIKCSSKLIKKYKEKDMIIFADRWIWTTLAYHFAKDNTLYRKWRSKWQKIEKELTQPDVSYFIIVSDIQEWKRRCSIKRNRTVGDDQLVRNDELRNRIINYFLNLNNKFDIIDNSGDINDTIDKILTSLKRNNIIF